MKWKPISSNRHSFCFFWLMGHWFHEITDRIEFNSRRQQNNQIFQYVKNRLVNNSVGNIYEIINTSVKKTISKKPLTK